MVRQRGLTTEVTIIDMSKSIDLPPAAAAGSAVEIGSAKNRKGVSESAATACQFNPALQELASRLSNKTRAFTLDND